MKERIKELAEHAGLKTELWNNPEPYVIYKEDSNNPGGLEKFAELLVRECARQVDGYWDEFENGYADRKILEHFGIGL